MEGLISRSLCDFVIQLGFLPNIHYNLFSIYYFVIWLTPLTMPADILGWTLVVFTLRDVTSSILWWTQQPGEVGSVLGITLPLGRLEQQEQVAISGMEKTQGQKRNNWITNFFSKHIQAVVFKDLGVNEVETAWTVTQEVRRPFKLCTGGPRPHTQEQPATTVQVQSSI